MRRVFQVTQQTVVMAAPRYRRVLQSDEQISSEEHNKKLRAERIEKITSKLHALVWVVLAWVLVYFTDLLHFIADGHRVNW